MRSCSQWLTVSDGWQQRCSLCIIFIPRPCFLKPPAKRTISLPFDIASISPYPTVLLDNTQYTESRDLLGFALLPRQTSHCKFCSTLKRTRIVRDESITIIAMYNGASLRCRSYMRLYEYTINNYKRREKEERDHESISQEKMRDQRKMSEREKKKPKTQAKDILVSQLLPT